MTTATTRTRRTALATTPRAVVETITQVHYGRITAGPVSGVRCECGYRRASPAGDLTALGIALAHVHDTPGHRNPPQPPDGTSRPPRLSFPLHNVHQVIYVSPNAPNVPHRSYAWCTCGWRSPLGTGTAFGYRNATKHVERVQRRAPASAG